MRRPTFRLLPRLAAIALSLSAVARAAPEAHLLRVDPRVSQSEGAPVLTTVVELVQNKRMSEALAPCAPLKGDAELDCQSDKLETPQALYSPLAPFPEKATIFTVTVDGADRPATWVSTERWGDKLQQAGVGTAWLILVDAAGSMGPRFEEAKSVANAFVGSMTPNDIVDVMFFNDKQVVTDSKWSPASKKAQVQGFISSQKIYGAGGRVRPLFNILKTAATDGFKELGNSGSTVQVPLHQAMVVLSNGSAGSDPSSTGPASTLLSQYMTKGRFPEDNTVLPKTPLPVISVWFPAPGFEEFRENSQEFMQNFANTDIGGFYDIVRAGQGHKGSKIVTAVRTRFNQMHLVKWRVSCISPTVTQTFKLVFSNTSPAILGDSTFRDVPMGIDPTAWPLDINIDYTRQMAKRENVAPGGNFTVYGNFCWGGEKDRAEVYFIPAGTQPPAAISGTDFEAAKRTQQQLIASGMRGRAIQSSDSDVIFEAPDKDKLITGTGDAKVARLVVYDNKAHRASGVTASTILTLAAGEKPLPWLLIVIGALATVIIALVVVLIARGSGRKRRSSGHPAPMVAGPVPVVAGGAAYGGGAPGYGVARTPPAAPPAAPHAAPGADFLYGGKPPQYGLTAAQPQVGQPPPADPYGAAPPQQAAAGRAVLTGSGGTYTVVAGYDTRVGRDGAKCQIVLSEPRVSSLHASLKVEHGTLFARDENSNNGTFLEGNRLPPEVWTRIDSGMKLRFGPVEFTVHMQ